MPPLQRQHAYERSYFVVDLNDGQGPTHAFHTVELPVATTEVVVLRSGADKHLEPQRRPGLVTYSNLVLVRGLNGRTDLSDWWEQMRSGDDSHRDVGVTLTDEEHQPVWSWWFTSAFPAAYRFSNLDADSSQPVDEILELGFARMSIK